MHHLPHFVLETHIVSIVDDAIHRRDRIVKCDCYPSICIAVHEQCRRDDNKHKQYQWDCCWANPCGAKKLSNQNRSKTRRPTIAFKMDDRQTGVRPSTVDEHPTLK